MICKKLYNLFHPKVGEIWCLHRVVRRRSPFESNRGLEISPVFLERLIREKQSQGCRFVDMDTFVDAANGRTKGRGLVHVTFDDGFADVFSNAYPILKQYGIPFTVYVTTDMPDGKADLWWLQLEQMAHNDDDWFEEVVNQVYGSHEGIADTMHRITSSTIDTGFCQQSSLTWEQIQVMISEGLCTVGSHGVSHSALPLLRTEEAERELVLSKRRLEQLLDIEVRHFSYPHSFFNQTTNALVWETGYSTAVIGYGGRTRLCSGTRFFYRRNIFEP